MKPMKFGVGQGVKRVEDVRLVSGRGRYASDAVEGAELRAVFLRSPHGHAKFQIEDVEAARAAPGVQAIYVASDFAHLGPLPCLAPVANSDKSTDAAQALSGHGGERGPSCRRHRRHGGRGNRREARDAVEAIGVEWEPLPAAIDMEEAIRPGAPLVFAGAPGNVAYDTAYRRQGRRPTPYSPRRRMWSA